MAVPQLAAATLIVAGARPGLAAGYLAGLLLVAWRWQRAAGPSRPWRAT